MDKVQAQQSIKKLSNEASNLNPSALITMFELDLGFLADERQIAIDDNLRTFRFHNCMKFVNTDIYFQNQRYFLCPIEAQNFEISSKGTLPTPILTMTVNDTAAPLLATLKEIIRQFGDIIGAPIRRKRTFAKFLDAVSFPNGLPVGFEPDPFCEFPIDTFYINRKTKENKLIIEYELVSLLDLEGINIPRRPIIARTCPFKYRGEGCNYEYAIRKNDDIHGEFTVLPTAAPPVATEEDKLISTLLGGASITLIGKWQPGTVYQKGHSVYLTLQGINYYFVANQNNVTAGPFDTRYWIQEKCSQRISGCKLRWGTSGAVNTSNTVLVKGELPYGGFPSTERLIRR